jgi:hypothetical protein
MTEPVRPDDRELEQYLAGGSKLSRRYRDASGESAPAALDDVVLAQARAEVRRKPGLNKALTPLAVAASVLLAVNLGWRVLQTEPVPPEMQAEREASGAKARALAGAPPREAVPAAPAPVQPPMPQSADKAAATGLEAIVVTGSRVEEPQGPAEEARARAEQDAQQKRELELRENFAKQAEAARLAAKEPDPQGSAAPVVDAALAAGDARQAPPLTDAQKIDKLIKHVGGLEGAVFVRNGKEYGPADAAKHMQRKRKRAGEQCDTALEFINVCASFSSQSGEAYLIRFADGRTRTAEDVLRDELARMEGLR